MTRVISFLADAQNTFKVIVKDSQTKELLAGATAIIEKNSKGGSSDVNGEIIIKNIPDGKQTIRFS